MFNHYANWLVFWMLEAIQRSLCSRSSRSKGSDACRDGRYAQGKLNVHLIFRMLISLLNFSDWSQWPVRVIIRDCKQTMMVTAMRMWQNKI